MRTPNLDKSEWDRLKESYWHEQSADMDSHLPLQKDFVFLKFFILKSNAAQMAVALNDGGGGVTVGCRSKPVEHTLCSSSFNGPTEKIFNTKGEINVLAVIAWHLSSQERSVRLVFPDVVITVVWHMFTGAHCLAAPGLFCAAVGGSLPAVEPTTERFPLMKGKRCCCFRCNIFWGKLLHIGRVLMVKRRRKKENVTRGILKNSFKSDWNLFPGPWLPGFADWSTFVLCFQHI